MNVLFVMFTKPLPIIIIIHHRSIGSSRHPPPAQCDIIFTIHPAAASVCVAAFASCQFTRSTIIIMVPDDPLFSAVAS